MNPAGLRRSHGSNGIVHVQFRRLFGAFEENAVLQLQDAIAEGNNARIVRHHEDCRTLIVGGGAIIR